jgi:hypothetical protein
MLKDELVSRGWSVLNDSPLAVLCVQPPAGSRDVRSIAASVLASGRAWVAAATFESNNVIRICVTNGRSTRDDVAELVGALEAAAVHVPELCPARPRQDSSDATDRDNHTLPSVCKRIR